jgi:hypothetical protein
MATEVHQDLGGDMRKLFDAILKVLNDKSLG